MRHKVVTLTLALASGCTDMSNRVDRFVTDLRVSQNGLQVKRCDVVHRIELMWSSELVPIVGGLLGLVFACRMTHEDSFFSDKWHYTVYYTCSFQTDACTSTRYRF